jgi:hypothetical protein
MASFSGLGAVRGGYLDTEREDLQNQEQKFNLSQKKRIPLVQGLQGDALLELARGGLLGGSAPSAGGAAPVGAPSAGVTQAAPPAASAPQQASAPAAGPPSGPPAIDPRADPNNPANWTSFQVASGPGAGQGGELTPSQQPSQPPQPVGPGGMPARPVPTQSFTPPSSQQGGGGPAGPGAPAPIPPGAGSPAPRGPAGQGLTLEKVIQAVTAAAKKRGQQITPDLIWSAVEGFVPLLSADDKMRFQLALEDQRFKDRMALQGQKDADTAERQQTGIQAKMDLAHEKYSHELDLQGIKGQQKKDLMDAHDQNMREMLGIREEAQTRRTEEQIGSREKIAEENIASKEKIADKKLAAMADNTKFNWSERRAIEQFRQGQIDLRTFAGLRERGRESDQNAALRSAIAKMTADERQAIEDKRIAMQAAKTAATTGERAREFDVAEKGRQDYRDTRTRQQQEALELRRQSMMQPGKSAMAQALEGFKKEYPNATPEQQMAFLKSGRPPTASEMKERDAHREIGLMQELIDSALDDVQKNFGVTGIGGKARTGEEIIGNIAGWTDDTTASDFHSKIDLLQIMAPRVLAGVGRVSNQEIAKYEAIIKGITAGSTKQRTISSLTLFKQVLQEKDPGQSGMRNVREPTEPPGGKKESDEFPGAPKPGTIEDGYEFKGGDPAKRENWKKQSRRSGGARVAMEDDRDKPKKPGEESAPPPSVWNWLNTDAPPGLLEHLLETGQIKKPPREKV